MASEILVKINVESGQADVSLKKAKASSDKLSKSFGVLTSQTNKNKKETASLRGEQKLATEQQKRLSYEMENAGKIASTYELSTKKAAGGTKQFRTQVGLNNAILTEAGRAASDLRFGFNGVANNVGQLASLFGSLINTSDNVATSLKNLFKSLAGTGGVMIAIQLLIAYGDQIYNFFAGIDKAAEDAKKQIDQLTVSLRKQIATINDLAESSLRYGAKGKLLLIDIKRLRNEFGEFETGYDNLTDSQKKSEDELLKLVEDYDKLIKGKKKLLQLDGELEQKRKLGEDNFGTVRKAQSAYQKQYDLVLKLQARFIAKEEDGNRKSASGQLRIFEAKLLQLDKLEEKYRNDSIDKDLLTEKEKIDNQKKNALISLKIAVDSFEDREKARLEAFIASTKANEKAGKITKEQSEKLQKDANTEFKNSMVKASEEAGDVRIQIEAKIQTKLLQLERDRFEQSRREQENSFELDRKSKLNRAQTQIKDLALLEEAKSQTILEQLLGVNRTEIRVSRDTLDLKKSNAEEEINRINGLLNNSQISQERRSELENELTTQQEAQTNTRVQILRLERAAREDLVQSVSSGLNAVSSLMKKGTDAQKAVSIAATLISTYTSAQKAYESQLTATPDSPIRAVIAATSAVVQGLARVQAIRKVNPSNPGNSSASAPNVQAPSFNVVGASATNQLAGAVAGQVNAPLRAYVVGSDISDQQELDRSIISTAGIG